MRTRISGPRSLQNPIPETEPASESESEDSYEPESNGLLVAASALVGFILVIALFGFLYVYLGSEKTQGPGDLVADVGVGANQQQDVDDRVGNVANPGNEPEKPRDQGAKENEPEAPAADKPAQEAKPNAKAPARKPLNLPPMNKPEDWFGDQWDPEDEQQGENNRGPQEKNRNAQMEPVDKESPEDVGFGIGELPEGDQPDAGAPRGNNNIAPPKPLPPAEFAARLKKLKSATVYVKTSDGTGSGFLVEVDGNRGIIVTNAHVVEAAKHRRKDIQCIFDSGTPKESKVDAHILGYNETDDIAILRVTSDDLPLPISTADELPLMETLPVLILGFPFGDSLTTAPNKNPAITVSKSSITSIRRDEKGQLAKVQLDGGVNPGNSGGPVVSEDGRLIGVSVAKVRGADIGFAIPNRILKDNRLGKVTSISSRKTGASTYELSIEVVDPLSRITACNLLVMSPADAKKTVPLAEGGWSLASKINTRLGLTLHRSNPKLGTALYKGIVSTRRHLNPILQVEMQHVDTKVYSPSSDLEGLSQTNAFVKDNQNLRGLLGTLNNIPVYSPPKPNLLKLPSDISSLIPAKQGKYLVAVMSESNSAAVIDIAGKRIIDFASAEKKGFWAASADKLVWVSSDGKSLLRWDLATMKLEKKSSLKFPGKIDQVLIGSSSNGPLFISGQIPKSPKSRSTVGSFSFLNLKTLRPLDFKPDPNSSRYTNRNRVFRCLPNGTEFLAYDGLALYKYFVNKNDVEEIIVSNPQRDDLSAHFALIPTPTVLTGRYRIQTVKAAQSQMFLQLVSEFRNRNLEQETVPALVFLEGEKEPVALIPGLKSPCKLIDNQVERRTIGRPMYNDSRGLYFAPMLGTIAIVTSDQRSVNFYDFDYQKIVANTLREGVQVVGTDTPLALAGRPWSHKVFAYSATGKVKYSLNTGPTGLTLDQNGVLNWKPRSSQMGVHNVIIAISDEDTAQIFHNVKITVAR